jgi:hypothetical protein
MSKFQSHIGSVITHEIIVDAAAVVMEIPKDNVFLKTRKRVIITARHMVFHCRYIELKHRPVDIQADTGFSHSDIINTSKNFSELLQFNKSTKANYNRFKELINKRVKDE